MLKLLELKRLISRSFKLLWASEKLKIVVTVSVSSFLISSLASLVSLTQSVVEILEFSVIKSLSISK